MKEVEFQEGATIFSQGDQSQYCYQIVSGSVEVRISAPGVARQSRPVPVGVMKSGDVFGEMSIIDQAPRSASAIALEDTVCRAYTADEVMSLLRTDPDQAIDLIITLIQRLRRMDGKLAQKTRVR